MDIVTRSAAKAGLIVSGSAAVLQETLDPILKLDHCAVCDRKFTRMLQCTRKFLVISQNKNKLGQGPGSVRVRVKENQAVEIWKGLEEVFEWRYGKENCTDLGMDKSLALCPDCGLTVAKLHGTINTFEEMRTCSSYVEQLTKKLEFQLESRRAAPGPATTEIPQSLTGEDDEDDDVAIHEIEHDEIELEDEDPGHEPDPDPDYMPESEKLESIEPLPVSTLIQKFAPPSLRTIHGE